jgi:apolipoprotein N-acyltransferase
MARAFAPTRAQCALAALTSLLLVLSFPDFNLWWLAWVGLVPLTLAVCGSPPTRPAPAFVTGWLAGTLYFYGSCWWLTHSMIHYGGIPAYVAFPLLVPGALIVALFPALWALTLARLCARWGAPRALLVAPLAWVAYEWARLYATGQLWNAVGYTQAYRPTLIQPASWGGVYAVGFLILTINCAISYALLRRDRRATLTAAAAALLVALAVALSARDMTPTAEGEASAVVVAVQPNVTPSFDRTQAETDALVARHVSMTMAALNEWDTKLAQSAAHDREFGGERPVRARQATPRVVVFPESPMNFSYGRDADFRELVSRFAREERAAVLFNSLESAPAGGVYNSAVLIDEEGRLVAQYDKIRLLPFGEYVPLPRWLGGGLVSAIVGEFTPGARYTLLPFGGARAGVFICFESAFPALSREFTRAGADVLINISNDGYLGQTPVLRQHLANAVFRAVENRRDVLRVTNTGISAHITPRGEVLDATASFEPATRTWPISRAHGGQTFYTRHGDLFVALCAVVTAAAALAASLKKKRLTTG